MTSIAQMGNSIGNLHQEVLKRAEQGLGEDKGVTNFSDRIGSALDQVASAQSDSANLTKAYSPLKPLSRPESKPWSVLFLGLKKAANGNPQLKMTPA